MQTHGSTVDMITGSTSVLLVFATPSFDEKGPDELLVGDCCAVTNSFDHHNGDGYEATQLKNGALRTAARAAGKDGAHPPSSFSSPSMRTHPYTYRVAAASARRISANKNNNNNNNNNDFSSRTPPTITTNTRAQQQRGAAPHPNALTARPPPSTAVSSSRRNMFVASTSTSSQPSSSAARRAAPSLLREKEQRESENKKLANRTAVQHYPLLQSSSWPPQGEHTMPQFFHQNDQPHFMDDSFVVSVGAAGCRTAVGSHHTNKNSNNRFTPFATSAMTTGTRGEQTSAMRGSAGIGSSTSSSTNVHSINNGVIGGNSCKNNSATTLLHTAISQLRAAGALPFVVDVEAFHGQEEAPEENSFSKSLMVDSPTSVAPCKTSLRSSSSPAAAVMAAVTAARRSIALKNLERDLLSGKWSGADTAAAVTCFPENGYRQQQDQREKDCQAGGADVSSQSGSGGLVGCVNLHINVGEFLRTYIHLHEGLREEEEEEEDGGDGRRNLYKKNETFQQQGYQQAPPSPQSHQKKRERQNSQQRDEGLIDGDSDVGFSLTNCSLLDLIFRAIKKFERADQQQQQLFSKSHSAFQNEGYLYLEQNKEKHHKNGGADERVLEFENKIKTVVDAVSMTKTGVAATGSRKGVGMGGHYGQTIIVIPILSVMGDNESKQRNTQTGNLGLMHRFSNVNNDYLLSSSSSSAQQYQSGHPSSPFSSSSPPFYSLNFSSSRGGPYAAPSFASSFISGAAGEFTTPTGMGVRGGQEGERWGNCAINNTIKMTMTANTAATPRPPAPPAVTTNNKNKKAAIANPNQQITAFGNRQVLYDVERERPLILTTMENESERGGIRANVSASSRLFRFPRINECVRLLSFSSSAHASPSYMYSNFAVPTAATTTANAQTTAALSSRLFPHSSSAVLPPLPPPPPPQPILVLCIAQSPSLLLSSSRDEDEEITSNPWEPTYLSNHCAFRLYAAATADDYDDCPCPQHVSSHQNQERPPRFFGSTQRSSTPSSASSASSSLQKWKRFGGDAVENLFAYCSTNTSKYAEGGSTNSGVGPEEEEQEEGPVRFSTPRLGGNAHDYNNNYSNTNSFNSNPYLQHLRTSSAPNNNNNSNNINEHRNNPLLLSSTPNHSDLMFIEACRRRDAFYASVGKAFSRVLLLTLQSRGEQHKRRRKTMTMMNQESSDVKRVVRPREHHALRVSSGGPKAVPPSPPTPPATRVRGHYTHPFAKNEDVSLHASRPVRQREQKEKGVESDDSSIFTPSPWAHVPRYSGPFDTHIGIGGSVRDDEASLSDP